MFCLKKSIFRKPSFIATVSSQYRLRLSGKPICKPEIQRDPCDSTRREKTRKSHNDLKCPDFTPYLKDPCKTADSDDTGKLFTYVLTGTLLTASLYGTKAEVVRYVKFMAASEDVLATAKIEVNLAQIPEDKHVAFKWRGKPLFVWHRTDAAVQKVRAVPLSSLRDPQRDEDRVKDPRWLVVMGVCTHLGCVPISHQGDFGGYYCPCHGSHFDISGRARKGPAPLNLEVPYYTISGDTLNVG